MGRYDDIINLPHHQSEKRPHMSLHDRAAQFAPFAALTGFDEKIDETARLTDKKEVLDEETALLLENKIRHIKDNISSRPVITVTRFVRDERKEGGSYQPFEGKVKGIDEINRVIIFTDGEKIYFDDILKITEESV